MSMFTKYDSELLFSQLTCSYKQKADIYNYVHKQCSTAEMDEA